MSGERESRARAGSAGGGGAADVAGAAGTSSSAGRDGGAAADTASDIGSAGGAGTAGKATPTAGAGGRPPAAGKPSSAGGGGDAARTDPTHHLPLRPASFSALAALADGPLAGFTILSAINETVPRNPILGPGTLYRLLSELRRDGFIEPVDPPSHAEGADERRQYHGLTSLGRAVLAAEAERLRRTLLTAGLLDPGRGAV